YEALVDRLLVSPHYGERWARRWMDLARYSDTNGYEKDRTRSIWPYRDWVINALNADKPFDQFTIEQIAGDLLPNPTREQLIATGFHRNTMLNEEGGIDPLEFRFHAMTDRVATTGITWLGLTVGCAQCHTHKYDPIPHREYYQIMAFLDNADEPELDLPDAKAAEQAAKNRAEAATLIAGLANRWPKTNDPSKSLDSQFSAWLASERQKHTEWAPIQPKTAKSNLPLLTIQSDDSVFGSGDISKSDTYELGFAATKQPVTAIRLEALPDDRLPAHGPGMTYYEGPKGDFFLGELQVMADGKPVRFKRATESYSKNNFGKNPSTAVQAIDGDPQTGWSCADRPGEAHEAVFVLEEPLPAGAVLSVKMGFGRHYACSLGRFRFSTTDRNDGAEATGLTESTRTLLQVPDSQLTAMQREQLKQQFLLVAPELAADNQRIRNLLKPVIGTTTLVFRERPQENPRATFIRNRGEFLQPTDRVEPGVLTALNPLPAGAPKNRLTFARWLVAKENPMTARVTVNRQWAAFFGRGLVRTTEDFGFQGELPTHPELLDWLAVEFMNQGWSLKKLHKLVVMSAIYRQSSATTDKQLSKDAENRWLSRGPRLRLEAELVRDSALKAAGLLTEKIGGPSVFPPQPAGVTTEGAYGKLDWVTSTGADRYRRGLYTFSKRTAPYAMYTTFDAPSGEACVARRDVSNTPLQALTLLNDTVFLETAQALGRTVAVREGSVEERVQWLFRRCLTRPASKEELKKLSAFVIAQQARFTTGGTDPKQLAGEGTGDAAARAAWTALARVLLNLDESITRG
ncbi:MAG TPA: DUF1549 and DUF1553 domain-containing protein, partial [Roseimicrobium sp.]|nr:DUF1549 and DUF1553 domain-containing protein [Roseimicrobium sp.]